MLKHAMAVAAVVAVSACSTTSVLLSPGTAAPSFSAPDQTGTLRQSSELLGKPLVVFFYPKDGTPGCTAEACAFRDAWKWYADAGVGVVGISTDDVASHKAFSDEHKLPYPLLSDSDGAIAKAYGVDVNFTMAKRVSFLLGPDGVIQETFPDVDPGVHAKQILDAAKRHNPSSAGAPAEPAPADAASAAPAPIDAAPTETATPTPTAE